MAHYIVGDIQGCYDPLQRLLDRLDFDPGKDRLWCCGDLVNRGGKSLKVLRFIYRMRDCMDSVLGNHDLDLLGAASGIKRYRSNAELNKIIQAHDSDELLDWLRHRPMVLRSKKHHVLVAHAGILPQWDMAQTLKAAREIEEALCGDRHHRFLKTMYGIRPRRWRASLPRWQRLLTATSIFTRMRYCSAKGKLNLTNKGAPGSQRKGYRPWFEYPRQIKPKWTIAFGHWAALGLHRGERHIGLDSGCVWGRKLSALRLENREVIQVPGQS